MAFENFDETIAVEVDHHFFRMAGDFDVARLSVERTGKVGGGFFAGHLHDVEGVVFLREYPSHVIVVFADPGARDIRLAGRLRKQRKGGAEKDCQKEESHGSLALLAGRLLLRYVSAAILLPAGLGVLRANGAFLTEAHDFELGGGKAECFKELASVFGARIAEGQIVFVGAALIAEAFDGQFVVGILGEDFAQGFGVGLERGFSIGANGLLVVVEVGVLDAIEEILDLGLGGV